MPYPHHAQSDHPQQGQKAHPEDGTSLHPQSGQVIKAIKGFILSFSERIRALCFCFETSTFINTNPCLF
jgi:hypothetical protein